MVSIDLKSLTLHATINVWARPTNHINVEDVKFAAKTRGRLIWRPEERRIYLFGTDRATGASRDTLVFEEGSVCFFVPKSADVLKKWMSLPHEPMDATQTVPEDTVVIEKPAALPPHPPKPEPKRGPGRPPNPKPTIKPNK